MSPDELQGLAQQLRLPTGDVGLEVADHLNRGNAFIVKRSIEHLGVRGGERVLEIGMANGYFAADILGAGPGTRYVGIDLSETMVRSANALNGAYVAAGWASFLHGDALRLPLGDDLFDAALTVNTVYFWDPLERALREIHRILKPGGRVSIGFRPRHIMRHYPFVAYGFTMYSDNELTQHLKKAGFGRIQTMEYAEPPRDFDGTLLEVATTVVSAIKA